MKRFMAVAALWVVSCGEANTLSTTPPVSVVAPATSSAQNSRSDSASTDTGAAQAALVLEDGVSLQPSSGMTVLHNDRITGLSGQIITSQLIRDTNGSFVVATHRGEQVSSELTAGSYQRSKLVSGRGRLLYEHESPLGRELAWIESDRLIVFVTSTDSSYTYLAAIADNVHVVP